MKVFNPKTKKNQDLFEIESLSPVFTVYCGAQNVVSGDKGCSVYLIVEAHNEEEAKNKALLNKEFTGHLHMDRFDKDKHLSVFTPSGLYVIGRVNYFEGDERL